MICDWHYFDELAEFPLLDSLQKDGFRVIEVTWMNEMTIKNFSHYAASHGAYGIMATTWLYMQKKEWDVVDKIIFISGKLFLREFPDEK